MSVKFTDQQLKAITHDNEDILVSAAAGSGKTAVLSERVLRKLKRGISIDQLVILTFTNKAAAEMKERIRSKIKADPSLSHELEKIDTAHIKTFDSFALFLLKRYGYLKNLSNEVSILETNDALTIKEVIMEEVFLKFFNDSHPGFKPFLDQYATKNDDMLKTYMVYFYEKMQYFKDQKAFEKHMENHYFKKAHFETLFKTYEQEVLAQVSRFKRALKNLVSKAFNHEKTKEYIDKLETAYLPLINATSYSDVHTFITSPPKIPALPKGKEELLEEEKAYIKSFRDRRLKPVVERLKGTTSTKGDASDSKDTHYEAFMSIKHHVKVVMDILNTFETRYINKQYSLERLDYATVAKTVLDIVQENPDVLEEIALGIKEIMVDEYQDTNALQESFLQLIKRDNLYMVGDIKQSIYRFRNAEPSIFAQKYETFKHSTQGKAIDLNKNFRSRSEVLASINHLFEHLMDHEIGGLDYDDNQALKFGNETFNEAFSNHSPYGLNITVYDPLRFKETYTSLTKSEVELMHIASDIKHKVENQTLQTKTGRSLRNVEYGDFAILIDKSTQFQTAKAIFDYFGVPLMVHRNLTFLDHHEIMVAKSLLTLVHALSEPSAFNKYFHHAFMSVMRSYIGVKDDDLIVQQYLALPKEFPKKDELLETLMPPFKSTFETLYDVVDMVHIKPIDHILNALYQRFNLYEKAVALKQTDLVINRLNHLEKLAKDKAKEGYLIHGFIMYLDQIKDHDKDIELSYNTEFSSDKVNLMTMHQSKGLEFPYIYIPHLFNPFQGGMKGSVEIDESLGVLLPHESEGEDKNFLYSLFRNTEKALNVSEKLRLLYVALTRAEEGIFLIMADEDEKTFTPSGMVDSIIRRNFSSFQDVLNSVLGHFVHHKNTLDIAKYSTHENYKHHLKSFEIPQDNAIKKTYIEPSETYKIKDQKSYSKGITELMDDDTLHMIDKGNLLHDTLEVIDFFSDIAPQLEALMLDENDKTIIKGFFNTSFIKSLEIKEVYKEYPFHFEEGEEVYTGFIDLLLKTSDRYIVIDYKLKSIDKSEYIDQVKGYVKTLRKMTDKKVDGYLYSILDQTFKTVEKE